MRRGNGGNGGKVVKSIGFLYQAWMVTGPGIHASLWPHKKITIILKKI
jgi:hypothetical protein